MAISACPAAVVDAPVEAVWDLLVNPYKYGWMDARVVAVNPPGKARAGQTVILRAGLKLTLTVLEVDEPARQIGFRLRLPLGMVVESHISCVPLNAAACRVQYG